VNANRTGKMHAVWSVVESDNSLEAAICEYCNMPFAVEKAVYTV
jgi:hypothetical protein